MKKCQLDSLYLLFLIKKQNFMECLSLLPTHAEGIRALESFLKTNPTHIYNTHSKDFAVHCVAWFNQEQAIFYMEDSYPVIEMVDILK